MFSGVYTTYSDLFDRQPSMEEIVEIIKNLPMLDAAFALSRLNALMRFAMQEPDRPRLAQIQQLLMAHHLDDEIVAILKAKFPYAKCDERPIFLPHCLLNILRIVLIHASTDAQPRTTEDHAVRCAIGRACLMMNNLLLTKEEESRVTTGTDENRSIELMIQFLTSFELTNPPKPHHLMLRFQAMYRTLLEDKTVLLRIANECNGFDFAVEFKSLVGLSLERWLFVVFAIYAYFLHGANPLDPRPDYVLLDPAIFAKDSGITTEELECVLKTISASRSELKAAIDAEQLTDPRYDFVPFRSKPLFALRDGKLAPIDMAFLMDKSHTGVHWAMHDPMSPARRQVAFKAWGILFEEYVHWLLVNMETTLPIKYIPRPKWKTGDESFDGILLKDSVLLPAEYKGGFLSRAARYSGKRDVFLKELDKKFAPGCDQLADKIGALFADDTTLRKHLQDLPIDHIRAIVPILVLQDHIFRVPLLNRHLNKRFEEKLALMPLRSDVVVRPLTVVNIQELESMIIAAEGAAFDFTYALHHMAVRDPERSSDLLSSLVQFPDFGKKNSPRMTRIMDELKGPLFSYLFPKQEDI